jgi:hypothetical protein
LEKVFSLTYFFLTIICHKEEKMKNCLTRISRNGAIVTILFVLLALAFSIEYANATVLLEWPDWVGRKRELKIYISNNGTFKPAVRQAMQNWNTANAGNEWNFVETADENEADVSIDEGDVGTGGPGEAIPTTEDGDLKKVNINVEPGLSPAERDCTIVHELGHCLRLNETLGDDDVMYPLNTATIPSANDIAEANASGVDPPCPMTTTSNAVRGLPTYISLIPKPGSDINLEDVLDIEIFSLTGPELYVHPDSIWLWGSDSITAVFEISETADHNEVFQVDLEYIDITLGYTGVLTITDDEAPYDMFPHAVAGNDTTVSFDTPVVLDGRGSYHDDPTIFYSGTWMTDADRGSFQIYSFLNLPPGQHIAVLQIHDYYGRLSYDTISVVVLSDIPSLSEWGLIILALLLLAIGTVAVVRRRKAILSRSV